MENCRDNSSSSSSGSHARLQELIVWQERCCRSWVSHGGLSAATRYTHPAMLAVLTRPQSTE